MPVRHRLCTATAQHPPIGQDLKSSEDIGFLDTGPTTRMLLAEEQMAIEFSMIKSLKRIQGSGLTWGVHP